MSGKNGKSLPITDPLYNWLIIFLKLNELTKEESILIKVYDVQLSTPILTLRWLKFYIMIKLLLFLSLV